MAKSNVGETLRDQLTGLLVAQGVVTILFGIAALFWPGLTAALFISLFGIFVIVGGITSLVHSLLGVGRVSLWWLELVFSILIIGLGVYMLRNPAITASVVLLLVSFTLIARGVVDVVMGLFSKDKDVTDSRWFYVIGGVLGIVAGVIVLSHPVATGLAFVWALGLYALLRGAIDLGLAFRLRAEG